MFEYSSGRVIALTRVVLAAVFFVALWIDPNQPVRASVFGYGLLFGYLLFAGALLAFSWRGWWWDHRFAWPAMVIDALAFLSAVFVTEGAREDFTSPFLAFFAFLMLAATIRWDWRITIITALSVIGPYLLVGSYIAALDPDFDIYRFARRIIYMVVLALVLAWLGLQRRERSVVRFVEVPGQARDDPPLLEQGLNYAIAQCGAGRGAIAWADSEEPYVHVHTYGIEVPKPRLGPQEFNAESGLSPLPRLFDRQRSRSLVARNGAHPVAFRGEVEDALAELCSIDEGLALPLASLTGHGELLLCDIDGVSADHVEFGALIAREVSAAFDREATLALANESALARVRDSLARDLHDSVAQSLAGASLRLEGLRAWIRDGGDPEAEIDAMKLSLRQEQAHVRSLIARLRVGPAATDLVDACAEAGALLPALARQWNVEVRLAPAQAEILVAGWMAHEIGQVLREAVANAVRHGDAREIEVSIGASKRELVMTIADDGRGFEAGGVTRPKSISDRIERLAGRLSIKTGPDGTRLELRLPTGTCE